MNGYTKHTVFAVFFVAMLNLSNPGLSVENTPSYLPIDQCAGPARLVIDAQKIPKDRVHLCSVEPIDMDNRTASFVQLSFGDPKDCPSGCFYSSFTGVVVPGNPLEIAELPGPDRKALTALLIKKMTAPLANQKGLACTSADGLFDYEIVRHNLQWNWHATLKQPFTCRAAHATTQTTMTGGFFLHLDRGQIVIEADHFTSQNLPVTPPSPTLSNP